MTLPDILSDIHSLEEELLKKKVILPIKDFENLLEDLEDLAITAERRDEETIDHNDVIKELKRDGIL